jgi:hypothetical protein
VNGDSGRGTEILSRLSAKSGGLEALRADVDEFLKAEMECDAPLEDLTISVRESDLKSVDPRVLAFAKEAWRRKRASETTDGSVITKRLASFFAASFGNTWSSALIGAIAVAVVAFLVRPALFDSERSSEPFRVLGANPPAQGVAQLSVPPISPRAAQMPSTDPDRSAPSTTIALHGADSIVSRPASTPASATGFDEIRRLLADGRRADAMSKLAALRKAHPDWAVPADILASLPESQVRGSETRLAAPRVSGK